MLIWWSQTRHVIYLSAWLRIINTVINEYPWKNPLHNDKYLLLGETTSYVELFTKIQIRKQKDKCNYLFITASKSWTIIAMALKAIPKIYNQKFCTFIFLEGRFLIIACKIEQDFGNSYVPLHSKSEDSPYIHSMENCTPTVFLKILKDKGRPKVWKLK